MNPGKTGLHKSARSGKSLEYKQLIVKDIKIGSGMPIIRQ
jgi:hypothetical protein